MIEAIAILAALVIAILTLIWAIKVIKETLVTGLLLVLIFVLLYLAFRITPSEVYEAFLQIPQVLRELVRSARSPEG